MRIGTYNMISQIYGNTGTKKTKTSGTTGSGSFLDQVSFSSMGNCLLYTSPSPRD